MTTGPDNPGGGGLPSRPPSPPPPPAPGLPSGASPESQQQAALQRLLDAVVVALLDCTPGHWSRVTLRAQRETVALGREVMSVLVDSPEGLAEPVVISQALRDGVERLWAGSRPSGVGWRRLTLEAWAADGKDWDFKIDLKYGA